MRKFLATILALSALTLAPPVVEASSTPYDAELVLVTPEPVSYRDTVTFQVVNDTGSLKGNEIVYVTVLCRLVNHSMWLFNQQADVVNDQVSFTLVSAVWETNGGDAWCEPDLLVRNKRGTYRWLDTNNAWIDVSGPSS